MEICNQEKEIATQRHLSSIPLLAYSFLLDGAIWIVFGM